MKPPVCLLILAVVFCTSCSNSKKSGQAQFATENIKLGLDASSTNKIVFITYQVSLVDSITDEYSFKVKEILKVDGTLKKEVNDIDGAPDKNYLYYSFFDQPTAQQLFKVKDPLKLQLEYPGDGNTLEKTIIKNKTGELTIRFQYRPDLKTISIFKAQPNTPKLKQVYNATL